MGDFWRARLSVAVGPVNKTSLNRHALDCARDHPVRSPFRRSTPLFYGWVIVAVMAVIGGWTLSMGVANFGFFFGPMREELDFDLSIFGWASTARTLGAAGAGILIGRLLDSHGPRVLLAVLGGGGAILLAAVSQVTAEWHLVVLYLGIGLLGLQGGGQVFTAPIVSKWFVRLRPRAMSMTYLGLPVILIFTFPLTQYLIDTIGWRTAWTVLGLVGFAIIVPSSFFLLRRQPEDMGLRPDGGAQFEEGASTGKGSQAAEEEYSWTRAEALRSFTFWRLTLAFGLHMMGQQSVSLYRFLHYSDQGVDASIVSFAASAEGVMSIVSALSFAYVVSKLGLNGTAAIGFGFMALSHSLTVIADDPATVTAALMLFGLAVTYLVMAQNLFFPAYFGRRHIGAIRGVSLSVSLTFGAISGPLTGLIAEATNSFAVVWWPAVGILVFSGLLIVTTKRPTRRAEPSGSTTA